MRKLFWFLVVLAVLAVGADRGLHLVAERTLADRVQSRQQLRTTPEAEIAGFPFLTQVYDGRFDRVTVTEHDVRLARSLDVDRLVLSFRDVTADRKFRTFEAARGTATARIPYDQLGKALGLELRYAGSGAVRVTKTVTVGGQTVRPTVSLHPEVLDGALSLGSGIEVGLGSLPFDIRPTSLTARPGGVVLRLSGKDLRYTR